MVEKAQIKSVFINSPIFDDVDPNPFDFNTEGCQEVAPIDLQECKISGGLLRIENVSASGGALHPSTGHS